MEAKTVFSFFRNNDKTGDKKQGGEIVILEEA
jgi:hypothetical protein